MRGEYEELRFVEIEAPCGTPGCDVVEGLLGDFEL